jgi:hypothetical protein
MRKYGIKTILDLRRMDRPCREKETVCQKVSKGLMYLVKVCHKTFRRCAGVMKLAL